MFKMNFDGISKLVVYGNGKKYFESERALMKVDNDRLINFNLSMLPKNARKENLNRKDNYFLKYDKGYYLSEKATALYIHISEITVSEPVEKKSFSHDGETNYKNFYNISFVHGAKKRVLNVEKLNVSKSWTIPEEEKKHGAHWYNFLGDHNNSYQTLSDEEIQERKKRFEILHPDQKWEPYNLLHWFYTIEDFNSFTKESDYYTRTEKEPDRLEREKIAKKFTEILGSHNHISHYDIDKLMKHFNITEK